MLGFSTISENAISEFPFIPEIPNLFVQIFSDVSVTKVEPLTTLALDLGNDVDELKTIYYGGNRNAWLHPLEITDAAFFSQKFNFVDETLLENSATQLLQIRYNYPQDDLTLDFADADLTSASININDTYEIEIDAETDEFPSWLISDPAELNVQPQTINWNIFLNINDPGVLSIETIQKIKDDDVPSAAWNSRPGLPISPIGYNSIGIDLFDGGFTSFPDVSVGQLDIEVDQGIQTKYNYPQDDIALEALDNSLISSALNTYDTYQLETEVITSFTQKFNFVDVNTLETQAFDQIQARYNFPLDDVPLEIIDVSDISTALNDYSTAIKSLAANTFSKEYTFLQQETVSDNVQLRVNIESYEVYVEFVERGTAGPVQIWIG